MKLDGNDPWYDSSPEEKDRREAALRREARRLRRRGKPKEANRKERRAREISREKSKRAHRGTD
ncbi:MAG: hypothetical protein ABSG86_16365 [Thermoguttaceae bacterium]